MTALTHKENDLHNRLIVAEFNLGQAEKELRRLHEENKALRARLAQPEPEPVAWYYAGSDVEWHSIALDADLDDAQKANCTPLYTAPPQREWQGLTDEEMHECAGEYPWTPTGLKCCRAIEAKLKEKNG